MTLESAWNASNKNKYQVMRAGHLELHKIQDIKDQMGIQTYFSTWSVSGNK